jgi:hypothetical protein
MKKYTIKIQNTNLIAHVHEHSISNTVSIFHPKIGGLSLILDFRDECADRTDPYTFTRYMKSQIIDFVDGKEVTIRKMDPKTE